MSYGNNPYRRRRNFDINVSSNTYAGEVQAEIMSAAVSSGDTLANGWVHQIDGIHHKAVVSTLNAADTIQAAACSFDDGTNLTLGEKVLTLSDLKVNEEICRKTVYPTWQGAATSRASSNAFTAELQNAIVAQVAAKTAEQTETIIWQGLDDGSGTTIMEGLLGDGTAASEGDLDDSPIGGCQEVNFAAAPTASTVIARIGSVYSGAAENCPAVLTKADINIYVSPKTYAIYLQALAEAGGQGFLNQVSNQAFNEVNYLGVPVRRCPGMFDDMVLLTYADNLKVGTNLGTDLTDVKYIPVYDYDGSDNVRVVMQMGLGVQCITPGDVVLGSTLWT
jgi:hypothetical protein